MATVKKRELMSEEFKELSAIITRDDEIKAMYAMAGEGKQPISSGTLYRMMRTDHPRYEELLRFIKATIKARMEKTILELA